MIESKKCVSGNGALPVSLQVWIVDERAETLPVLSALPSKRGHQNFRAVPFIARSKVLEEGGSMSGKSPRGERRCQPCRSLAIFAHNGMAAA